MGIINVKGTHDIIGGEAENYSYVENVMSQIASFFAFKQVRPPVLEHSELFVRGVGESSDVVRKEMYTFDDKGGRSLTLRPEFTAGIMRLIVQNKLLPISELPLKLYYCGPVFRYERPQLGRYRQFNQFGVESVGHASPYADVEVISLAYTILQSLGLQNVTIKINTLGDEASRDAYRAALKDFFKDKVENMCEDCKMRYQINPLRILDCKVPSDQEIVKDAPKMSAYISEASQKRFSQVLESLKAMDIPYEVDDTLVRGLDYYSETVFEFHYVSNKGNDYGAIGAGGHYDKLVHEIGGPDAPGVGFSFGVERLVSVLCDDGLLEQADLPLDAYVMPLGIESQKNALMVANELRVLGYRVDMCYDDVKLSNMFKRAEKKQAKLAIIIGEEEIKNEAVVLKNMETKEQITVSLEDLGNKVDEILMEKGE
ncbi:MAG: histidine--tRNA ligase [Bacilli bacterium]|nr:histidine--tRNA ligase [Bacilli bacterium]